MWAKGWRDEIWVEIGTPWDVLIVGGGITGAGILREAARLGLRTLLVDQRDFGWGTSSRSSKLVHGGLRYLKEGRIGLTMASVHEREHLLDEGPGLIEPLGFMLANYEGSATSRLLYEAGLSIYDLLALHWSHTYYSAQDFKLMVPHLSAEGLKGGFRYGDAQTDDARLVLRIIREAVADGGVAINYVKAENVLCKDDGRVTGATLRRSETGETADVTAQVIINATGAWADGLRGQIGAQSRIRPLRGSHLVLPSWRLPVAQAISFLHPLDQRPVFMFPWEGITLVGTTDVDHRQSLDIEPAISPEEVAYLLAAISAQFPSRSIGLDDIIASFAGVRPVIGSGKSDPSDESRDHVVWEENGLITVTGGKLTTFRIIALDVLKLVRQRIAGLPAPDRDLPVLNPIGDLPKEVPLDGPARQKILGRYGADARALIEVSPQTELSQIPGTPVLWAELRWAARMEGVVHLDDLLLRRTRLGLLLPDGGSAILPKVRAICQPELGWNDERWREEEEAYQRLVRDCYGLPAREKIPSWQEMLSSAERDRCDDKLEIRPSTRSGIFAGFLALVTTVILAIWSLRRRSRRGKEVASWARQSARTVR